MNIKHFLRDIFIWFVSVTGMVSVYQQILRKKGPLVRIIAFHDVADRKWFEDVIAMLVKDFNVITPLQFNEKSFDQKKINILLTFDDGYQSWIDVCLPVLKRFSIKGLFFINSGLLDIASDSEKVEEYMKKRLLITAKDPLTWESARQLVAEGHTVGGHTVSHPNVASLSQKEIYEEVHGDKNRLESQLQIEVSDFAYPFGTKTNFSDETIALINKMGIISQYLAVSGFCNLKTSVFKRTLIEKHQEIGSVKRWINGGYDIFKRLG